MTYTLVDALWAEFAILQVEAIKDKANASVRVAMKNITAAIKEIENADQ